MKLLFLNPYLPGPPIFGGQRRIHGLMTSLAPHHEVSTLALVETGDHRVSIEDTLTYCRRVETVVDDRHRISGSRKRLYQFGSLLTPRSWERWLYWRPKFQSALDAHLAQHRYDVIVSEFVFMAGFSFAAATRAGRPRPLLVIDEHNVEYDLLRRTAEAGGLGRRFFNAVNWRKLKREETGVWRRFDGCTVTSTRDEAFVHREAPGVRTAVVPNGVDVDGFHPRGPEIITPKTLLYFGAINYYPNTDATLYFADQIWPLLRSRYQDVRFRIVGPVGEGQPQVLALKDRGIDVMGFVDDVKAEIAGAEVVVVPLRMGGGTRLKILEAMSMGKAIVSTRIGAEGIDVEHEKDILLADTPEEFAREVGRVLTDRDLRERLGRAARQTAVEHYSWRSAAGKMSSFFEQLASPTPGGLRAKAPVGAG